MSSNANAIKSYQNTIKNEEIFNLEFQVEKSGSSSQIQ